MSLPWHPWYRAAFKHDTLHLTLAQEGAYRRLLDEYYEIGGPLPDDDVALARLIGVTTAEWMTVSEVVRPFFKASNHKLVHKRCEDELHAMALRTHSKRIKAKASADARWKKYRELKEIVANALPPHSERNANGMRNDATKKESKKEGSDGSLASLGGALRSPSSGSIPVSAELSSIVAAAKGLRR